MEKDGNQPVKPSDTTDEQYLAAKLCFAVNQALIEFKQLAEDLLLAKNLEKPWNYDLKAFVENAGKANFKMHGPSALAQHHGIPTFLLDWTKRPEIAAFFASSESQNDCGIAVFALRRTQHPLMLKGGQEQVYHFVEESPAENAFLHAQRGIFTTHLEPYHFMKTGEYEPLEKKIIRAENTYSEILLKKIILQKAEVPRLAMLLSREEFTQAHLMPTLDNVAKTVMSRLQIK